MRVCFFTELAVFRDKIDAVHSAQSLILFEDSNPLIFVSDFNSRCIDKHYHHYL